MIEQPTEGELYYKGHNFLENDSETKALRRKKIQIVFQNPYASLNPRKKLVQFWKNHCSSIQNFLPKNGEKKFYR